MNSYFCCGNRKPYQLPIRQKKLGICKRRPPRCRSRHESKEHRLWRERNLAVIQRLSQMIRARPEDIDDFLYELTLKNYSRLLNPRECGWSACKVPLCYPNVCDRYMGIFDRHGNLRDPTHPKSLLRLLQLLQDFLNGATHEDCQDLPIYAEYPGGRRSNLYRFHKGLLIHEPELDERDDHKSNTFFWNLGSPETKRTAFKRKVPLVPRESRLSYSATSSPRMSIETRYSIGQIEQQVKKFRPKKSNFRNSFGRQSVFLNDELALAHEKSHDFIEELVNKALERRRSKGSHVGPIGNLKTERMRILIKKLIELKGRKVDPKELKRTIEQLDIEALENKERKKKIVNEISKLYSSIVQSKSETSVSQFLLDTKPKSALKRPKKYLGQQHPLQFHEPIADQRRSTLQRRESRPSTLRKHTTPGRGRLSTYSTKNLKGARKRRSMKKS